MNRYYNDWKKPFKYKNGKFPGFIGLSRSQFNAVVNRQLQLAMDLGISYDDYMSLLYKNHKSINN